MTLFSFYEAKRRAIKLMEIAKNCNFACHRKRRNEDKYFNRKKIWTIGD